MVDLSLLAAEIVSLVWGTSANFNGFVSWQHYCTAQKWASAKLCGVEQMLPLVFGRAAITLGMGPHSSFPKFRFVVSGGGGLGISILRGGRALLCMVGSLILRNDLYRSRLASLRLLYLTLRLRG